MAEVMRFSVLGLVLLLAGSLHAQMPPASENTEKSEKSEKSERSESLEKPAALEKPKTPSVNFGGVVQIDTGWFAQTARNQELFGDALNGANIRTARLWVRGALADSTNYMLELDFGALASPNPGRPNLQNAFLEQEDVPWLGTVRVGRWKQPFSLETASSIRHLSFLERANLFTFVPFRRTGIGFFDCSSDERHTWAASVFRSSDDGYGDSTADGGNGFATAIRLTGLLWHLDEKLLHIGVGHHWNGAADGVVRFARFPEFAIASTPVNGITRATPNLFDTGILPANHYNAFSAEAAWVHGPFSIQAESVTTIVDRGREPTAVFFGWYAYTSWFLTGESRAYLPRVAAFDRITPRSNFLIAGDRRIQGLGAWELLARVSQVNVNDAGINGGQLTTFTAGVNWYWNPYTKWQFNYIHGVTYDSVRLSSSLDIYALRLSLDF